MKQYYWQSGKDVSILGVVIPGVQSLRFAIEMNTIKTICVCGAGTMGSGIAQVTAMAGFNIIQFDVNREMLEKSRSAISKSLEWYVSKRKISIAAQRACLGRIRFTNLMEECIADLFIEAIIEDQEAKVGLFKQLALINSPLSIYATNTSSISITAIAGSVQYPSRVVGLHFFNPATKMKLVEVVKAEQTDNAIVETMMAFAKTLGKIPVVCNDAPGFIVNRVARQYYLEALKMVESGQVSFETIDAVMEATGFKMGPFRLMDLIGIDINYAVSNIIWEALGKPERLMPPPLQKAKIGIGELGRKSGKGFYDYAATSGTIS